MDGYMVPETWLEEQIIWMINSKILKNVPLEPCEVKELRDYQMEAINRFRECMGTAVEVIKK